MRPMAMALQLLGSSYLTPCKGLRIPLMFQLTKRNMSTPNYNVFKPAPNAGARGNTGNSQVQQAWASRARARICAGFLVSALLNGRTYVGRDFKLFSFHW